MKYLKTYIFISTLLIAAISLLISAISSDKSELNENIVDNHKVYELRTYTTYDGKLDDLHERFADHTMAIFENHGMENIAYWTPMDKENTLIYIIAHESREAAEENWNAFGADPEWQEAYQASREDGPIVEHIESVFMTSTPYSPME